MSLCFPLVLPLPDYHGFPLSPASSPHHLFHIIRSIETVFKNRLSLLDATRSFSLHCANNTGNSLQVFVLCLTVLLEISLPSASHVLSPHLFFWDSATTSPALQYHCTFLLPINSVNLILAFGCICTLGPVTVNLNNVSFLQLIWLVKKQ